MPAADNQQNRMAQLIGGPPNNNNPSTASSWFVGAPITRLCAVGTVVLYVLCNAKSAQDSMAMDSFQMLRAAQYPGGSREWHRYFTSKLIPGSTGELVVGGMLLTVLARQFEREMGSRKFGLFILLVNFFVVLLEMVFVGLSTLLENGYRYQGPYPLLGAFLYLFHRYTPRLHPRFFGILGFTFSEKSFYYLWFVQVVGYRGWNTIIAASFGALTAYAYILSDLHQTLDFPDAIAKPLASIGAHLSEPPPRILAPTNQRGGGRGGGGGGGGDPMAGLHRMMRNQAAQQAARPVPAPAPAPPAPPDPAAIEQLTSMGFERQRVVDALQATNNNVERAADRLLSG